MVQTMFATAPIEMTLFDALLEARQQHGGGHPIADDIEFKPLTYRGLKVWKLKAGYTLDFAHQPTKGFRLLDVVEGKLSADPY